MKKIALVLLLLVKHTPRNSRLISALGLHLLQAMMSPAQFCNLAGIPPKSSSGLLRLHPTVRLIEQKQFIQYFLSDQRIVKGPSRWYLIIY